MNILLINQFFWPDTAATGQLLSDVADHLGVNGAEVSVICGSAKYGGTCTGPPPLARITRVAGTPFSHTRIGRVASYLTFLTGTVLRSQRKPAPDVVVTLTTPPLLSWIGMAIQLTRSTRHIIWEMDVYPDVAIDLGVLKAGSAIARAFGHMADIPRHHAERIIVLGECMRTRLLARGIPDEKIFVAENWAHGAENAIPAAFPEGLLSIVYSGNLGLAHDVETVAEALPRLDPGRFRFTFAGSGSRHAWLQDHCTAAAITNTRFLPYCDREELTARLASGHIGLVTQREECLGSVVPSKTYGIMAASRPVLYIGPKQSTPARIIREYNCGWQIDNGDTAGLVSLLRRLDEDRGHIAACGARAFQAFQEHYKPSTGAARIAVILGLQPAPQTVTSHQLFELSGRFRTGSATAVPDRNRPHPHTAPPGSEPCFPPVPSPPISSR